MLGMDAKAFRISIHTPRRWRDGISSKEGTYCLISIHTPRRWRDLIAAGVVGLASISIHTPRRWRDSKHAQKIIHAIIHIA